MVLGLTENKDVVNFYSLGKIGPKGGVVVKEKDDTYGLECLDIPFGNWNGKQGLCYIDVEAMRYKKYLIFDFVWRSASGSFWSSTSNDIATTSKATSTAFGQGQNNTINLTAAYLKTWASESRSIDSINSMYYGMEATGSTCSEFIPCSLLMQKYFHQGWFIPSREELRYVYNNKTYFKSFIKDQGSWVWSSSFSPDFYSLVYSVDFNTGAGNVNAASNNNCGVVLCSYF